MFLTKLISALLIAAPFSLGLVYWHWDSEVNAPTGENPMVEIMAEHNLKEAPPEGSDLAQELQGEVDKRKAQIGVEEGQRELFGGEIFLYATPGLVLGLFIGFSGMLPWCQPPPADHRIRGVA